MREGGSSLDEDLDFETETFLDWNTRIECIKTSSFKLI